jgi:hypothetical protein
MRLSKVADVCNRSRAAPIDAPSRCLRGEPSPWCARKINRVPFERRAGVVAPWDQRLGGGTGLGTFWVTNIVGAANGSRLFGSLAPPTMASSLWLSAIGYWLLAIREALHQRCPSLCQRTTFAFCQANMSRYRLILQPVARVHQTIGTAVDIRIVDLRRVTHHD